MSAAKFAGSVVCVVCAALVGACASLPKNARAPEVSLVKLSVVEANASDQRFRVTLQVKNPNAFDIPISAVRFSARLAGQGVLMGDSSQAVTLPAKGTSKVPVDVTTDLVSSVRSLLAVSVGPNDALPYELNGELVVAGRQEQTLPFSFRGQVPLTATVSTR